MEPFEDENPFSTADPPHSSASSNSHVDVSAPSSPPNRTVTLSSPPPRINTESTIPRSGFPSQGSGHSPRVPTSKSDFCCARDHWLHSGEDTEILVSAPRPSVHFAFLTEALTRVPCTRAQITDAQKTSENSTSPYITYVIRSGVSPLHGTLNEL
jgi:sorting nexin-41/42